ncbi:AbrB/MazE/SpoVT family DNA-binding domain-containing protein [Sphingomonas naphthae]|uniref:AbrB/MazE/SpoVT family DNA-binding domain-containing protein n=1 Tax=Sphingomonas naphthae TaxID=1813468 RepID=A0ABY7TJ31_9SPHN|nr:AbrB/MazE/SpoVT family DNA-binding domain-containing protein [Sphingomonas naphthae]WCT72732.1 AbrB/MazE/SpoVT family DNA-binding domain-containing protein [Sphingomonas naphthae]
MTTHSRLTIKGQVTIPKDVRDLLDLKPGDTVAFEQDGDRISVRKAEVPVEPKETPDQFRKRLHALLEQFPPLPSKMSTDEYMAMIREPVPAPR